MCAVCNHKGLIRQIFCFHQIFFLYTNTYIGTKQLDKDRDIIYNRLIIGGKVGNNVLIGPHKVPRNRIWGTATVLKN